MRIIAGKYKSRIIKMPKGAGVRPTKDRVREALFNIIGEAVCGASVLDAFAGSGAFGIEALSRGAKMAVFIDSDRRCIRTIKENLRALAFEEDKTSVIRADALKAFSILGANKDKFNIIILDPPYHKDVAKKSLIKLDGHAILKRHCIIVVERYKKDILPEKLSHITSYRTVCYGDIYLTFYKAKQ